jgi:hypothetical protein
VQSNDLHRNDKIIIPTTYNLKPAAYCKIAALSLAMTFNLHLAHYKLIASFVSFDFAQDDKQSLSPAE